ncbi:class I SAM-dependent methyltransferase [Haliangium sp.]|uniref:class I SAM-dependent methyltransferase n=1 Tax=Haliangium sp. TaxID=2663208 RepID=UPI003D14DBAD
MRTKPTADDDLYPTPEDAYAAYRRDPAEFFARYQDRHTDERTLISPDWRWYETKYHYNLLENAIIDLLRGLGNPVIGNVVLDVGAGTGHWIEFYLKYLEAREVVAVDFSPTAVERLRSRYLDLPAVTVQRRDICEPEAEFEGRFDVVNAIGVMFHIVDDARWRRAVANLCRYLRPGGVAIIGGDFGDRTEELGVMRRVRSLALWEEVVAEAGGRVAEVKRFDWFKGGVNPGLKNNLLAFCRPAP